MTLRDGGEEAERWTICILLRVERSCLSKLDGMGKGVGGIFPETGGTISAVINDIYSPTSGGYGL
jgi:hypothetical protein